MAAKRIFLKRNQRFFPFTLRWEANLLIGALNHEHEDFIFKGRGFRKEKETFLKNSCSEKHKTNTDTYGMLATCQHRVQAKQQETN